MQSVTYGYPYTHQRQSTPARPAPPGTFAPGTKVQVGRHRVIIDRYLNEGGFAHVYVVKIPLPNGKDQIAVLKRVAVPDKDALAGMRVEVETMKKLRGHRHIVTYIDSHASQLVGGGFEVFLLMEFCAGGGLIDFMNTRLQIRLTEPEILKIFSDVAQGVACMHYLRPCLLHRDLKVENVLISGTPQYPIYKICDFGSTAPPIPAATSAAEGRKIEDDIQRHTTLQYRSPEMIDVYSKMPINEKSDIWALGVLLYKLCYYTTPFEGPGQGQTAILNAKVVFPPLPAYSTRTKLLVVAMLQPHPDKRPNIYQVVKEVCILRNRQVPIPDIYSSPFHPVSTEPIQTNSSDQSSSLQADISSPEKSPVRLDSPSKIGLQKQSPPSKTEDISIPDVTPMRRGRPPPPKPFQSAPGHNLSSLSKSTSANSSDPFATFDVNPSNRSSSRPPDGPDRSPIRPELPSRTQFPARSPIRKPVEKDELSSKFPSLDEFDILHQQGMSFDFPDSIANPESNNALRESSPAILSPNKTKPTNNTNPDQVHNSFDKSPGDLQKTDYSSNSPRLTTRTSPAPKSFSEKFPEPVPSSKTALVSVRTATNAAGSKPQSTSVLLPGNATQLSPAKSSSIESSLSRGQLNQHNRAISQPAKLDHSYAQQATRPAGASLGLDSTSKTVIEAPMADTSLDPTAEDIANLLQLSDSDDSSRDDSKEAGSDSLPLPGVANALRQYEARSKPAPNLYANTVHSFSRDSSKYRPLSSIAFHRDVSAAPAASASTSRLVLEPSLKSSLPSHLLSLDVSAPIPRSGSPPDLLTQDDDYSANDQATSSDIKRITRTSTLLTSQLNDWRHNWRNPTPPPIPVKSAVNSTTALPYHAKSGSCSNSGTKDDTPATGPSAQLASRPALPTKGLLHKPSKTLERVASAPTKPSVGPKPALAALTGTGKVSSQGLQDSSMPGTSSPPTQLHPRLNVALASDRTSLLGSTSGSNSPDGASNSTPTPAVAAAAVSKSPAASNHLPTTSSSAQMVSSPAQASSSISSTPPSPRAGRKLTNTSIAVVAATGPASKSISNLATKSVALHSASSPSLPLNTSKTATAAKSFLPSTSPPSPSFHTSKPSLRTNPTNATTSTPVSDFPVPSADTPSSSLPPPKKQSSFIQARMKEFLTEANKKVAPPRTATGYGRWTNDADADVDGNTDAVERDCEPGYRHGQNGNEGGTRDGDCFQKKDEDNKPAVGPKPVGLRGR